MLAARCQFSFPVRLISRMGGGGWGGLWWGLWRGALEGRKASETWMCGEEGSYEGGILPEVNGIKVGGIIWA